MNYILILLCVITNLLCSCKKSKNDNPTPPDPPATHDTLSTRLLVIVVDGLRADYVSPEYMPNLYALGQRGVMCERSCAALPSVTRANAATISTGSYPSKHGMINNYMWNPDVDAAEFSTSEADNLELLKNASGGHILTTVSAGEVVEKTGLQYLFCGTSGSGTSLIMNPRTAGKGIYSTGSGGFFRPASNQQITQVVGNIPGNSHGKASWAADVYLQDLLGDNPSDIATIWFSEVDGTQHTYGVGSPEALDAVASVDANIGRIVSTIDDLAEGKVNVFVTADHGFTTSAGELYFSHIRDSLASYGIDTHKFLVAHNMIYLREDENDIALLKRIVEVLQRDSDIGAIFTKPLSSGSSGEEVIPGTLSTSTIHWNNIQRHPAILYSANWNDDLNEYGFPGKTTRGGEATHGSSSPYDLHIPLVAIGPDIKQGVRSTVPTGNVDLMPTVLHLAGIPVPDEMDGRVLKEVLKGGPSPESVQVVQDTVRANISFPDGLHYQTEIRRYQVDGTTYFQGDYTKRTYD